MNCRNTRENLSSFVDGELDPSQTAAIKAHIIRCSPCRSEKDQLERVGSSIRNLTPVVAPPDFEFKIYAGIRNSKRPVKRPAWIRVLGTATAVCIGILIGSIQFQKSSQVPALVTDTQPRMTASDYVNVSPVVSNEDGIVEYTMDGYFPYAAIPASEEHPIGSESGAISHPDTRNRNPGDFQPNYSTRYVLDPVPARAGYEKTIY